jgi:hypothetical protein
MSGSTAADRAAMSWYHFIKQYALSTFNSTVRFKDDPDGPERPLNSQKIESS